MMSSKQGKHKQEDNSLVAAAGSSRANRVIDDTSQNDGYRSSSSVSAFRALLKTVQQNGTNRNGRENVPASSRFSDADLTEYEQCNVNQIFVAVLQSSQDVCFDVDQILAQENEYFAALSGVEGRVTGCKGHIDSFSSFIQSHRSYLLRILQELSVDSHYRRNRFTTLDDDYQFIVGRKPAWATQLRSSESISWTTPGGTRNGTATLTKAVEDGDLARFLSSLCASVQSRLAFLHELATSRSNRMAVVAEACRDLDIRHTNLTLQCAVALQEKVSRVTTLAGISQLPCELPLSTTLPLSHVSMEAYEDYSIHPFGSARDVAIPSQPPIGSDLRMDFNLTVPSHLENSLCVRVLRWQEQAWETIQDSEERIRSWGPKMDALLDHAAEHVFSLHQDISMLEAEMHDLSYLLDAVYEALGERLGQPYQRVKALVEGRREKIANGSS